MDVNKERPLSEAELLSVEDSSPRRGSEASGLCPPGSVRMRSSSRGANRPLSEVEINVMNADSPVLNKRSCSLTPDVACHTLLLPPSMEGALTARSLEDIHRENVYMSLNSQVGYDFEGGRRGSWGEKNRLSRRKSTDKEKRRGSSSRRSTETLVAIEALQQKMKIRNSSDSDVDGNDAASLKHCERPLTPRTRRRLKERGENNMSNSENFAHTRKMTVQEKVNSNAENFANTRKATVVHNNPLQPDIYSNRRADTLVNG